MNCGFSKTLPTPNVGRIGNPPYRYTKYGAWSAGGFKIKERSLCPLSVYHWGDQQCLVQALLVAETHEIDLEEIRRWSKVEGKLTEFEKIVPRLVS
jgi:hypothetical protein